MIWLTRSRKDSETMAKAVDVPTIVAPVVTIVPCDVSLTEKPNGIILTSRNAVPAIPKDWQLPLYCVGDATADTARQAGFGHIAETGGDAMTLAALIAQKVPAGTHLLYLRGEEVSIDIEALLATKHIHVHSVTAYRAQAEQALPQGLTDAIEDVSGVMFFSQRSAHITIELLRVAKLQGHAAHIDAYCLSLQVADAASALPWRSIKVAESPTRESMIKLIASEKITAI